MMPSGRALALPLVLPFVLPALAGVGPVQNGLAFAPGERMTYRVHMNGVGSVGRAVMSVQGPIDVRGTETYLLRSETTGGIGPLKRSQVTESWVDPVRMRSLRFHERERNMFVTHSTRVEIFPDDRQWTDANGGSGVSQTNAPLDELSFIYFLRSLPDSPDTTYELNRHFDAGRNPVSVRVSRGDTITTKAGVFATVLMEMRVHDPSRYRGEGIIRVYLSDDACRIPVRIESTIPTVGAFVLTLDSYERVTPVCG